MEKPVRSLDGRWKTWANLPLRWKGFLGGTVPVATLVASMFLFGGLQSQKTIADREVHKSQDIRAQLQNAYIILISAESGVRNYALTGREDGLLTLSTVGPSLDGLFDKVQDLVRDNSETSAKLSELRILAHQRLSGLAELRDYYEAHRLDKVPAPADLLARAKISPDVLLAISALGPPQVKELQERTRVSEAAQARYWIALAACVVVGLAGGLLTILMLTTSVVRRVAQLQSAASELEAGRRPAVAVGNGDELGRLAQALQKAGTILASRDRQLRLALENAQLLIWELNLETRQIRYQAGADAEDTILPVELLAPSIEGWIAGVHADDRDAVRRELDRALAQRSVLEVEYRVVLRGGEMRWMLLRAQRHGAGEGSAERLLGVLADVTERRKAADEIERQSQALKDSKLALESQTRILQSILDSMGDGVVVADTQGKFLVFNPAAREVLGSSRAFAGEPDRWAEHYGLFLSDGVTLCPGEQLPFIRAIRGENVDGAELFVRRAGAREANWVSVTARPLRGEVGSIGGGVMVMRDITAAKHNAEALELAKRDAENANQAKN